MDYRTALFPSTDLRFSTDALYTVRGEIGRGGSCVVYDGYYTTNAGDEKTVRIRECYPYDFQLQRNSDNSLACVPEQLERFTAAKAQMFEDFRLCNRLFSADGTADAIINTLNIYEANNTVYVVSAWSRENALPNVLLNSLRDCISVVRQTAAAVRSIHEAGFLYLDIKPDNISVINSSTKRVKLFDFDSLLPLSFLSDDRSHQNQRLSYTKGFAALELRRGQLSGLGTHTDVYGVGALLFFLLFGRAPEAPDCTRNAAYDFSSIKYNNFFPDQLFVKLTGFFRKSLASFPLDRYPDMSPVIECLTEIERLADPAHPYIISSVVNAPAYFIGRDREKQTLAAWFNDEHQCLLFVSGMGGIGKSTFVRQFLCEHRQELDSIAFLYFNGSIRQTILNDEMLRINGTERFPEETAEDYFDRKLRRLREITERDREKVVEMLDLVIEHARKAPAPPKKHLLAQHLLGKMNAIARRGLDDMNEFDSLYAEIRQIIDTECLPFSEIRHGFAITMGFYWSEVKQNQEEAEKWIAAARSIAEKRYPIALDYIDFMIVPPAIIYIDLRNYDACEDVLMEGIGICDNYPELSAYRRKKHDLQRYLLDVYLEGNELDKARKMIFVLDEECRLYGFPDTIQTEVRQYLKDSK